MIIKLPKLLLFILLLFSSPIFSQVWNPNHSIGMVSGNYYYTNAQTPEPIVEIYPASYPNTGIQFQWESSATVNAADFTSLGVQAQQSSYTFSGPLSQTTYYRRKTIGSLNGTYIYSNTIKVNVVSANWEDRNYLRKHDVLVKGVSSWQAVDQLTIGQKLQTTTYLDGLGRSIEKVSRETATPAQTGGLWGDMVQFSEYDAYGRESKKHLPYTTTNQAGKFKTAPVADETQYYTSTYNETSAFSLISFDNSPLNRITNVKSAGAAWANGLGNSASYDMNASEENVQWFTVDYVQGNPPVNKGSYNPNTLYKMTYTDENGKKVIEYTNKQGQLILRKIQLDDVPSSAHVGWICTYSIYDDFGLLRYQLQPEAVKYLDANGWSFAGIDGPKVLDGLCFQYDYDDKGRIVWKKAPGAKPLRMLYDIRDRVVFMQDGNQAGQPTPEWTTNLYDDLDRPVITTLYKTTKTTDALQVDINNAVSTTTVTITNPGGQPITSLVLDTRQAGITRYAAQNSIEFIPNGPDGFESLPNDNFIAEIDATATNPSFTTTVTTLSNPITNTDLNNTAINTIVKYQFYDTYTFAQVKGFDNNYDNLTAYSTTDPNVIPIASSKRTTSFATGSLTRVLGTNTFLAASNYYDEKGNLIQTLKDNIKSGKDVTTFQYHFDGRLLSTHSKHTTVNTGYSNFSILSKNVFDKIGRVTSIQKKYRSNAFKTIASYDYDDVGRLKTKHLDPGYTGSGKDELEALNYSYNLHNNITGINKDYALKTAGVYDKWNNFFGLYLEYDNKDGVFASANLNGQVAGLLWNTQGDDAQRKYDYTYDNAGRLVNALFKERGITADSWSNLKMDFSVSGVGGKITYDLNGNLISMLQKGVIPGQAPVAIDDLSYSYGQYSNKLLKVTDNTTIGSSNGKFGDFKDGSNSGTDDYVYDDNGNLVIDLNKNVKDLAGQVGASGIRYNFLDKPEEIRIAGKGTINIVYDAAGNKLQRKYTPEGTSNTTITSYINEYVYQGDALQYINFEEGRIRVITPVAQDNGYDALAIDGNMELPNSKKGVYDFYIRDYQENVRMILTEETHFGSNKCTMETARSATEESIFGQAGTGNEVVQTRFAVSQIPGQTTGGGWQNGTIGSYVSRLSTSVNKTTGPNTLLKVMAGDKITASTQYYYQNPVTNTTGTTTLVNDVITSILQAITGSGATTSVLKGATTNISGDLNLNNGFRSLVEPDVNNASGNNPKAYLTMLFFDERFNYVGENSQNFRVNQGGVADASLTISNIKAPKNGYCFVYVSNESGEMVYFDNLAVAHTRGRIIEENHYYAYGLKIAAISSKKMGDQNEGQLNNNYQYQGAFSEMDEDIQWNEFFLRDYDAQIGRFVQQDPFQQFASPYIGMANDPINGVDPSGGIYIPWSTISTVQSAIGGTVSATTSGTLRIVNIIGSSINLISTTALGVSNVINRTGSTTGIGYDPKNNYQPKPRPTWNSFFTSFPKTVDQTGERPARRVYEQLGGDIFAKHLRGDKNYQNACAIRVSMGLNGSGFPIDAQWADIYGADGSKYILTATKLKAYLLKKFDKPDVVVKGNPLRNVSEREEMWKQLAGKKGIWIMEPSDSKKFEASGHATFFDGKNLYNANDTYHTYFYTDQEITVSLWILK